MIQPIQFDSTLNFKGMSPSLKARTETNQNVSMPQAEVQNLPENKEVEVQKAPKKKFSIKETYRNAKKGVVGFFKGMNNVTNVTGFALRDTAEGIAAMVGVGAIGNACSQAKDKQGIKVVTSFVKSILKDIGNAALGLGGYVKDLFTKDESLLKQLGKIFTLPGKFFGKAANEAKNIKESGYLKGNTKLALLAVAIGVAVLALRTIQGKIQANQKNADLDHKTNLGHV